MCGIIGCAGRGSDTLSVLTHGLNQLEYRGYDSAGVALGGDRVGVRKRAGEIEALEQALQTDAPTGSLGIGHTRWSTHGPPNQDNAHPHTDSTGSVAVVHNGIIENHQSLRDELKAAGHEFRSDTDTEVIPRLIEEYRVEEHTAAEAFRAAIDRLDGSYAIAAVIEGVSAVFAVRNDSPLVLGIDTEATYLGSDVPAFLGYTDQVVYLDDGEFAELRGSAWEVTDGSGHPVEKSVESIDWDIEQTTKGGYDHYMLKEIYEQPTALRQGMSGRIDELAGRVTLDSLADLDRPDRVQFVACGTSYHAALYGARVFHELGIPAQSLLASEYATSPPPADDSLVISITQSGETADTLSALRNAQSRGAQTMTITNVVGSTAARECDHALYTRAGPEIGVAATKTFSSQLTTLNLLAEYLTEDTGGRDPRERLSALRDLPGDLLSIIDDSRAADIAERFRDAAGYFFIGRGYNHPVALEGALKFKEISYEYAEGLAAGELKHGTLALVTEDTPVFAVVTGDGETAHKTVGNVKEIQARGAPVVAVTDRQTDVARYADAVMEVPETHPRVAPLLANVQLQLVSYHVANALGRSIDKPRNLAKSVTVE